MGLSLDGPAAYLWALCGTKRVLCTRECLMADDVKDVASGSRVRRGAFPRMALEPVLQLVDGIFELGHGDPVRRRTAFEHVNRSPESSISRSLKMSSFFVRQAC